MTVADLLAAVQALSWPEIATFKRALPEAIQAKANAERTGPCPHRRKEWIRPSDRLLKVVCVDCGEVLQQVSE